MSDVSVVEIVLVVVQRDGRICLARRSDQVATSRGLWSVVTGYVEPLVDPLEQACRELDEELGLRSPDVVLVRRLDPLLLTSRATGKHFLVHPFLFESRPECQVVLNWEHTESAWAEPAHLADADRVAWQHDIVEALLERHATR